MKKIIYSIVAAGIVLTSCTKNNFTSEGNYPEDGVVRVTTAVNELKTKASENETYAGTNLSLTVDNSVNSTYSYSNTEWTNDGTAWATADKLLWQNSSQSVKVYAFAPFVDVYLIENASLEAIPYTIKADQTVEGATLASDFVVYRDLDFVPKDKLTPEGNIPVAFDHKFSQININILKGTAESSLPTIELVSVLAKVNVKYNILTDVVTAEGDPLYVYAAGSGTAFSAIIAPQTVVGGTTFIEFRTDADNYRFDLGADFVFEKGTAYTFNMLLGQNKLELSSVSVGEWVDGAAIDGGLTSRDVIEFEDPNFKRALREAGVDINNDGLITKVEAAKCTSLDISNDNIELISELSYFTNLTELNCSGNKISYIDLSALTKLEKLYCYLNSSLTELDVSNMRTLTELNCSNCDISVLDVQRLTKLTLLACSNNSISVLNVSNLTDLTNLGCSDNNISTLNVADLTKLESLNCGANSIGGLDLSRLSKLTRLTCHENSIQTLDVSNILGLEYTVLHGQKNASNESITLNVTLTQAQKDSGVFTERPDVNYVIK